MALLNYTSKVPPEQTISEIQRMLTKHGVTAMMTEYDGPHVSSVSFKIIADDVQMGFRVPCNWKAVYKILTKQSAEGRVEDSKKEQAIRTAWRIIHVWVKAQLAIIEIDMVKIQQVFLPYTIMRDGRTLSEHVQSDPGFLLGSGN